MSSQGRPNFDLVDNSVESQDQFASPPAPNQPAVLLRVQAKAARRAVAIGEEGSRDRLLTADEVAARLNVTKDWIWDHSSRKAPFLPVIRIGDGTLRYRASKIEEFINERERLSVMRRKHR